MFSTSVLHMMTGLSQRTLSHRHRYGDILLLQMYSVSWKHGAAITTFQLPPQRFKLSVQVWPDIAVIYTIYLYRTYFISSKLLLKPSIYIIW